MQIIPELSNKKIYFKPRNNNNDDFKNKFKNIIAINCHNINID